MIRSNHVFHSPGKPVDGGGRGDSGGPATGAYHKWASHIFSKYAIWKFYVCVWGQTLTPPSSLPPSRFSKILFPKSQDSCPKIIP